jgi:hypothetical protein
MAEIDDGETYSPQDLRDWLRQEIRDLTKATELRLKDATDFVTAYAVGEIDAEEAARRLNRYQSRWGDSPIRGQATTEEMSNDEILKQIDASQPPIVREMLRRKASRQSDDDVAR